MLFESKKSEKEDEKIAASQMQMIEDLRNRRFLFRFLYVCTAANFIIWLSVILFPNFVYESFSRVFNLSDKVGVAILGIPFGFGLYNAYCLFRLKFPDAEDNKDLQSDMMASFNYQAHSSKRWFIWLFSIIFGVINLVTLIFANFTLSGNL